MTYQLLSNYGEQIQTQLSETDTQTSETKIIPAITESPQQLIENLTLSFQQRLLSQISELPETTPETIITIQEILNKHREISQAIQDLETAHQPIQQKFLEVHASIVEGATWAPENSPELIDHLQKALTISNYAIHQAFSSLVTIRHSEGILPELKNLIIKYRKITRNKELHILEGLNLLREMTKIQDLIQANIKALTLKPTTAEIAEACEAVGKSLHHIQTQKQELQLLEDLIQNWAIPFLEENYQLETE